MESVLNLLECWDTSRIESQRNKVCIVTGVEGPTGVGYLAAKLLASKRAHVILTGCDNERGQSCVESIKASEGPASLVEYMKLDLSSFRSVKEFSEQFKARQLPCNMLVLNPSSTRSCGMGDITEDGIEVTLQTSHFGPFLLTQQLMPELKESAPARVVFVSSPTNAPVADNIDWTDLRRAGSEDGGWCSPSQAYGTTKLLNITTVKELQRRLKGCRVDCYVCQAETLRLGSYEKTDPSGRPGSARACLIARKVADCPSAESAALPILYCATAPELTGKGGRYICKRSSQRNRSRRSLLQGPSVEENTIVNNPEACKRMFEESMKIVYDAVY